MMYVRTDVVSIRRQQGFCLARNILKIRYTSVLLEKREVVEDYSEKVIEGIRDSIAAIESHRKIGNLHT